jgi:UDP-glucuronate decarboxylase
LAQVVLKLTNSKSEIIFEKLPSDDPKQRKPDIAKAKAELGWSPSVKLEDGLRITIEDFEKRLGFPLVK